MPQPWEELMDGFIGQVCHFPGTMVVSRSKVSVNGTNGMKKIELCDIFNKSNVKHRNTLSGLDQYMCRGLRLWNCQDHEAI